MLYILICFSSVQFSCSFMSHSLWLYGLLHHRHPCPSPPPRAYSNSCPSSWRCHPTISSSVIPFSPSIPPSTRVFSIESVLHIRWANYWSFSFNSVLPMNIQDWFPLGWTSWISLQSKALSRVFNTIVQKHLFFGAQLSLIVQLSHPYMTTGKNIALSRWTFAGKVMPLLFNMLSRLVITFLPRNMHLLISWLQSPSGVILEPPKIKSDTVSIYFLLSDGTRCHDLRFLNVEL